MNEQAEPIPTDDAVPASDAITSYDETPPPLQRRPWLKAVAIGAAGLIAGGVVATTLSASADETNSTAGTSASASQTDKFGDRGMGPAEEALTGDTKEQVEAAVLAEYPDATIERTETDRGGVYESHITTADGEVLTVLVDADFNVTGTETGRGGPEDATGTTSTTDA